MAGSFHSPGSLLRHLFRVWPQAGSLLEFASFLRNGGSLSACLLLTGCAIPDYHLPGGFSSTYYRALQQSEYERTAAQTSQVYVPVVPAPSVVSSAAPANPPQSSADSSLAGSGATPTAPAVSSGWREWVRGIRPGRQPADEKDSMQSQMEPEDSLSNQSVGTTNSGLLGSSSR